MAAQRRPPNWEAFTTASGRVVEALQGTVTIPDDLNTMAGEIRQLEHQPSLVAIEQQLQQHIRRTEERHEEFRQEFQQVRQEFQLLHGEVRQQFQEIGEQAQRLRNDVQDLRHTIEQLDHQMIDQFQQLHEQFQQLQEQFQQFQGEFPQLRDEIQQIQRNLNSMSNNMTARIFNASLQRPTELLAPLVNPNTNEEIEGFPVDSATLAELDWHDSRELGRELGLNVPAFNVNAAMRAKFLGQLRVAIGLKPIPAA